MLVIQPIALVARDEELTAVGVGTTVGHGKQSWFLVLQTEVLIRKALPEDTQTSRAVALHEISTLDHEVLDDSVEGAIFVADGHLVQSELAGAKLTEILGCLRHHVAEELHLYSAHGVTSPM